MFNEKVAKLLNEQVNKEFYSAYLYLDMSNYYTNKGLVGFANWFKVQAQEERDHAMLFVEFLQNNGYEVTLEAIAKPQGKFTSNDAPLRQALEHEQFVTASIHNIYAEAKKADDFRTMEFLQWFIKEQGEEEKNANDLILMFELYGNQPNSLFLLDKDLAARTYNPPSLVL